MHHAGSFDICTLTCVLYVCLGPRGKNISSGVTRVGVGLVLLRERGIRKGRGNKEENPKPLFPLLRGPTFFATRLSVSGEIFEANAALRSEPVRFAPFLRCGGLLVSIRALSASLIVGGAARGLGFRLVRVLALPAMKSL